MRKLAPIVAVLFIQISSLVVWAEGDTKTLVIDKANSKISFIANATFITGELGYVVEGIFSDYDAKIQLAKDFVDSKIQFKVKINSVKTKTIKIENKLKGAVAGAVGGAIVNAFAALDSMRDSHLKSADYFDAANFPEASFRTISITKGKSSNEYVLKGKLTIHGISQTGEFDLKVTKQYQDSQNKKHTVFEAQTTFSRIDFGVGVTAGQVSFQGHTIKIEDVATLNILLDTVEAAP